jgi:hypothetical protein
MEERRSSASALNIILSSPTFLQLPYEDRLNIYREAGIVGLIIYDLWWIDCDNNNNNNNDRVPLWHQDFHLSNEVLSDSMSAFWSENIFKLVDTALLKFLRLGSPITNQWSSLRYLTVELTILRPGRAGSENVPLLRPWRQACINLGSHLPPSQLTLHFTMCLHRVPRWKQVASMKSALNSMLKLPVLKNVLFKINPVHFLGLHRKATRLLKRLTCPPTDQRRSPFQFMDLPAEIRYMILEHTDLIAPGLVIPSILKGYTLEDCCIQRCPQRSRICYEYARYDSSQICWSLPAELFLVNRHISAMSTQVFFSHNAFVVDIRRALPSAPLIRIPAQTSVRRGLWCPKDSNFLQAVPPECIPILRSLTWRLPMVTNNVAFSHEREADFRHTIDFIAQNVDPSPSSQ